jgi:acyl carrier protein
MSADSPPLRGVLHLAATVEDGLLANATEDSYRRLLRPKMAGAWNIYHAVNVSALDFWVSFSSIAAVVSQPGQGAYSAANAFLDCMAHYASSRGVRMQSLQWGPWADTGLAHEAGTQRSFRAYAEQGIQPMTQEKGVAILEYALTQSAPVALTAVADWPMFLASSSAQAIAPEFSDLVNKSPTAPVLEPDLREQLSALSSAKQRGDLLEAHIREQLAAVLKTSPQRIDPKKPLGSMGVDSLMALELVRRLSRSLGVKIPATAVFNYPTVAKLVVHVQSRMAVADSASIRATPNATISAPAMGAVPSANIQVMSDDDALRSLIGGSGSSR